MNRQNPRPMRALPLTLSGLLLLGASGAALAQSSDDAFDLGTLILRNQEDATGPVGDDTNPPTVTGSKVPVTLNEVPQSVSVLGRDEIERFGANRTSEALRYTAGVTSDVFGDDNDYDWLRIRGFQADQTGIYLDNAQNLSFAFGSFFIDPYTLERIEVLRGPSSALYGGSNPGGIVNYVSKRPGGRIRELSVGVDDATGGWLEFDMGDDLDGDRSYRVTGRLEGGDKYDAFNKGWRGTLAPSFRFTTDGGTEVTLLANIHVADEKHNGSTFLPYFGTVEPTAQFGFIDPDANFSDPDWDSYKRRQASVSAIVEHEFDNGFTFTGIGRLGVAEVKERYYYPFGYAGYATTPSDAQGTLSMIAFEHDTLVKTAQTDLRYYGTVQSGAVEHDLLFGLDARYYELDETQASGFGTNRVVNPLAPGIPILGAPYQDATTKQDQVGLYVQDQIRWGNGWLATLNLRHDFVNTRQDGAGAFSRHDSETSYRAALAYEAENGFTPYLSYSTFFNPLIASTTSGVTDPETGDQIEAGFKWAPDGGPFSLTAAAFRINRENVVTGVFPNQSQLGKVRSDGVEIEGRYDFGNGLQLAAAATFLDVEIRDDSNLALIGNTPTLIPESELSLYGSYEFSGSLKGLQIGAGIRHRGESYADPANTRKVSSATVYDLFASYDFTDRLSGQFSVTNVGDKRYVTGCQDLYTCSYGSGREISVSLTSHF